MREARVRAGRHGPRFPARQGDDAPSAAVAGGQGLRRTRSGQPPLPPGRRTGAAGATSRGEFSVDRHCAPDRRGLVRGFGRDGARVEIAADVLASVLVVESQYANRVSVDIGQKLPFNCTASGSAFLSAAPEASRRRPQGPLPKVTPKSMTSARNSGGRSNGPERAGFAFSDQGFEEGVVSVAAPIIGARAARRSGRSRSRAPPCAPMPPRSSGRRAAVKSGPAHFAASAARLRQIVPALRTDAMKIDPAFC